MLFFRSEVSKELLLLLFFVCSGPQRLLIQPWQQNKHIRAS
jgi:hypothetical protein